MDYTTPEGAKLARSIRRQFRSAIRGAASATGIARRQMAADALVRFAVRFERVLCLEPDVIGETEDEARDEAEALDDELSDLGVDQTGAASQLLAVLGEVADLDRWKLDDSGVAHRR